MNVQNKLDSGEYKVTHIELPPKATLEERRANWEANRKLQVEAIARFRADLEEEHEITSWPETLRDQAWSLAKDHGHACGMSEFYIYYEEFVELALAAYAVEGSGVKGSHNMFRTKQISAPFVDPVDALHTKVLEYTKAIRTQAEVIDALEQDLYGSSSEDKPGLSDALSNLDDAISEMETRQKDIAVSLAADIKNRDTLQIRVNKVTIDLQHAQAKMGDIRRDLRDLLESALVKASAVKSGDPKP